MAKEYSDRAMSAGGRSKETFFFPKNNPPVAVEAETLEEAEEIIKDKKDIKDTVK